MWWDSRQKGPKHLLGEKLNPSKLNHILVLYRFFEADHSVRIQIFNWLFHRIVRSECWSSIHFLYRRGMIPFKQLLITQKLINLNFYETMKIFGFLLHFIKYFTSPISGMTGEMNWIPTAVKQWINGLCKITTECKFFIFDFKLLI